MARLAAVLEVLESIAPRRYTFEFDRVGLQVGTPDRDVERALVSLDRSVAAADEAIAQGAGLLVAHHPLIFRPLSSLDTRSHVGKTIAKLLRHDIAFFAAHTNWDSARGGVNDALAARLGLENLRSFGTGAEVERLKLAVFAPPDTADAIVDACAQAGAGVIGEYGRCAWQTEGVGTFEAGHSANPVLGRAGERAEVRERRIEMVLRADQASAVVRALRKAHPYEEPAFDLVRLQPEVEQRAGRLGEFRESVPLAELLTEIEERLDTRPWAWGDPDKRVRKIAVVGGAADDEWIGAQRAGADVLVTGEVKQHVALEASESGFCIVAAGHYATEQPGVEALVSRLQVAAPEVEWLLFEPQPGCGGRPLR